RPQGVERTARQGPGKALSVRASSGHANGYRFPRNRRLLKPEAFTRVFRDGFRSQDAFFTLLAIRNDHEPRLGLAVSRKVSSRADGRNRNKRQVRECFRTRQASLPGIDIVVMARREAAGAPSAQLRRSLERHWQRLAQRCDAS